METLSRGLDLGGSEVRIGITENEIYPWPAKCMEIAPDAPIKTYLGDESSYDDFIIVKHPLKVLEGRRFVRNDVIDHFNGKAVYCDNQSPKTMQEATYINAAHAVARIAAEKGDNDFITKLGVCIPTSEFYADIDYVSEMRNRLIGDYTIKFPLVGLEINYQVPEGGVVITPEGVVAVYAYSKIPSFREGITLIVDVGERSTDITILKNFKPIGQSAASRPIGGVNIEAYVRSEMEKDGILLNADQVSKLLTHRYIITDTDLVDVTDVVTAAGSNVESVKQGIFTKCNRVTDADVDNAMNHYFIKQGDKIKDVTDYVIDAKEVFASSAREAINEVLNKSMYNIAAVNNFVPIGRAFSGSVTSESSLVRILVEELHCTATVYQPENLATANVASIMAAMRK